MDQPISIMVDGKERFIKFSKWSEVEVFRPWWYSVLPLALVVDVVIFPAVSVWYITGGFMTLIYQGNPLMRMSEKFERGGYDPGPWPRSLPISKAHSPVRSP